MQQQLLGFTKTLTVADDGEQLEIVTPYNSGFVFDLKSNVPHRERSFDYPRKAWFVSSLYAPVIKTLLKKHYGYDVVFDSRKAKLQSATEQTFILEYIGTLKQRENGETTAFGNVAGEWHVVFSEDVLREFFNQDVSQDTPGNNDGESGGDTASLNLYQILGSKQTATDSELKSFYRRMARQWHPDVCLEPDAATRFREINEAYKILSEPNNRKLYDAGLAFERLTKKSGKKSKYVYQPAFQIPFKCGVVKVFGREVFGKFRVSKIASWDEWTQNGKTAVSSWQKGNETFTVLWV